MATENLKNALQNAGLTPEEFADIIKVDPKSVQRWVDGPTKPYPRNRAAIARALNLTEHDLWPEATPPQTIHAGAGERQGAASEVTGTWASATGEEAPDPVALIQNSDGAIDLLDNGRGIELTTPLRDTLVEQANAGRHVRLLTCLPKRRLEPLIGHRQIEVRVIDACPDHSLFRARGTMLLTFNLAGDGDQAPPLLKLTRTTDGGLFDRLANNFEALWEYTDATLTDAKQLDAYLTNIDEDDVNDDWPLPPGQGERAEPERIQRRWPRRPE
jgi:DNA-binding transcriptional regulator YdaS (Cro superfamily)